MKSTSGANVTKAQELAGHFTPYIKELRALAGSVTGCVMMQRLDFWFKGSPEGFYKFQSPCRNPLYRPGDSWCEELGLTPDEFCCAFDHIGKRYTSKGAFDRADDKFDGKFFCSYYNKISHLTYYFRNHELLDAEQDRIFSSHPPNPRGGSVTDSVTGKSRLQDSVAGDNPLPRRQKPAPEQEESCSGGSDSRFDKGTEKTTKNTHVNTQTTDKAEKTDNPTQILANQARLRESGGSGAGSGSVSCIDCVSYVGSFKDKSIELSGLSGKDPEVSSPPVRPVSSVPSAVSRSGCAPAAPDAPSASQQASGQITGRHTQREAERTNTDADFSLSLAAHLEVSPADAIGIILEVGEEKARRAAKEWEKSIKGKIIRNRKRYFIGICNRLNELDNLSDPPVRVPRQRYVRAPSRKPTVEGPSEHEREIPKHPTGKKTESFLQKRIQVSPIFDSDTADVAYNALSAEERTEVDEEALARAIRDASKADRPRLESASKSEELIGGNVGMKRPGKMDRVVRDLLLLARNAILFERSREA